MHRKIVYFLFILAFIPTLLMAGTKGRIKGKVVDLQTGEPLISANVLVVGTSFGAATDVNGEYVLLNLDAGVYTLKATYLGYKAVTITNVRVNADLTTYIDFELPSEDITTETVTIVAQKPLIKKDATSSVRIASAEDIKNLPVRGVTSVISLQAGVVNDGGVRIRGSRPDEVGFYLDGVNITDPVGEGRMVSIGNDAVEEIQVESGGFSAEYGGANAGIVRTQLRTGGTDYHFSIEHYTDNFAFQSADDFYNQEKKLGTYWYGHNTTSFVASGPILSNKFRFFYNLEYNYNRTSTRKGYDAINIGEIVSTSSYPDTVNFVYPAAVYKNDQDQSWSHAGTILMDFNPIKVRIGGTYSKSWYQVGSNTLYTMNRDRYGIDDVWNGNFSAKITHVLSPKMYYEVTGGYSFYKWERTDQYLGSNFWAYGDSVANANAGAYWERSAKDLAINSRHGRYIEPVDDNVMGFAFARKNSIPVNYLIRKRSSMFFRADFSLLAGKHHSIKIGGEFQQYTIRSWGSRSQSSYAQQLSTGNLTKEQILYNAGVNNYGYDVLGNEYDGDGLYAPKKPVFAGFYIQDKIEYSDIILNLGVRYDYFDTDNWTMKNPANPETAISVDATSGKMIEEGWEKASSFSSVSPRLSVSFPVTDKTVFHAGFGKYIQQPSLGELYNGVHNWAYQIGGGFFFSDPAAMDLKPTRKTHYEFGFKQQLTDFMAVDISAYYDDIKDQVQFHQINTNSDSPYQSYTTKANSDFATTKGLEITLNMRRYQRVAVNANLSFSDAKGTGSYPNSNAGIVGAPLDGVTIFEPKYVSPLAFNRPFSGNVSIDYRFGQNDGPDFLHEFGVNLLATFNNGHPYTRGIGGGDLTTDARDRRPIEPLGASSTPSQFRVDLRVDKTFHLMDQLALNVYVRVLNLFDSRYENTVYAKTGSAVDDGYISSPEDGGKLIETYGPIYEQLYKARRISRNGYFSNARQIMLGVRLEY